ncbi:MAG TPA: VWA domain-containing protein [Vicinamibacteria bacterium]|nr:VWA domain-containing protein [Vicinamibacteria bacterium]
MWRAAAVTAALVACAAAAGPAPQADRPPVFGAGVDVVRLDVIVLDKAGRPVRGLTAGDFVVEEDGRPQAITSFDPVVVQATAPPPEVVEPPRTTENRARSPQDGRCVFLFFDDVHLTAPVAERVRAALRRYLDTEVREGDWVTLMAPEQGLWWTARSGWEYRQLRRVVDGIRGQYVRDPLQQGMSDWEAVCLEEYAYDPTQTMCRLGQVTRSGAALGAPAGAAPTTGGAAGAQARASTFQPHGDTGSIIGNPATALPQDAAAVAAAARRRIVISLDGLRQALESMLPLRGHKSVVLISEGFMLLPKMPGYQELIDTARRANVAVHFLDPRGLESGYAAEFAGPQDSFGIRLELDRAGSGDLADATGGHTFGGNDQVIGLRKVAAESEVYYLLGYAPDAPRAGERKVKVRLTRGGYTVQARSRYFVARPAMEAKPEKAQHDAGEASDARAVEAMRALPDSTELPLRAATLFFEENAAGEVTTLLATEVRTPAGETGPRKFKVATEARRAAGGSAILDRFEESVAPKPDVPTVLSRQWRLPAGVWQVRLLVEDTGTGRIGTAVHTFEVPEPKTLRLSTPLVTGAMETDAAGAKRPVLRLDRRFRPGGLLYCQFAVYGAGRDPSGAPQVVARWELRRGDGLVRDSEPTPIRPSADGRLSRTVGVSLAGAPPGDYTLTLVVEDRTTHTSLSRTEGFTVGS